MTKTKEELQRELRLLEEKEGNKNINKHTLVVMDENYIISDKEVKPQSDFSVAEQAIIMGSISDLETLVKPCETIIKKKEKASTGEWVQLIVVLDDVFTKVLSIVYDVKDVRIPSLPNFDLFEIFLNENEEFITDQVKSITSQFENISEAYENKK